MNKTVKWLGIGSVFTLLLGSMGFGDALGNMVFEGVTLIQLGLLLINVVTIVLSIRNITFMLNYLKEEELVHIPVRNEIIRRD